MTANFDVTQAKVIQKLVDELNKCVQEARVSGLRVDLNVDFKLAYHIGENPDWKILTVEVFKPIPGKDNG